MPAPERLSASSVGRARVDAPGYDRSVVPSIVHLGVGSFARAHLACYADDLLRAGVPAMIRGVSLRSPRAEEQLAPQDGLFTVLERDGDQHPEARVVGSVASVATGAAAAIAGIAEPATALVTVTVTEKGYELEPEDLDPAAAPRSAPAVIADGLLARPLDAAPPVVAALDNVLDNGRVLRAAVRDVVVAKAPDRLAWLDGEVWFPSSVVDRIVPATTASDLDDVSRLIGLTDLGAAVAEPHRSWVVEDVPGLPPLQAVGVRMVGDIEPWQRRKLWLLNGPHSALAHAGLLARVDTIAEAAADPVIGAFVRDYVEDVVEVCDLPGALEPRDFAQDALRRFRNPALRHRCDQVGADGSRKLDQRLHPVACRRAERGVPLQRLALVAAMWLVAVAQLPVQGRPLVPVDDPTADQLRRLAASGDVERLCAVAAGPSAAPGFALAMAGAVDAVCRDGVAALRRGT